MGEPTRPGRDHCGVDVKQLRGYVAEWEVADDLLLPRPAVDVLLDTTTHPCELGGGVSGQVINHMTAIYMYTEFYMITMNKSCLNKLVQLNTVRLLSILAAVNFDLT